MSLFQKIFKIKKRRQSAYSRNSFLKKGRKVYKTKTIRIKPEVLNTAPKVKPEKIEKKITPKKPLPEARKISPTKTIKRAKQKQTLDLRQEHLKRPEKGIIVLVGGAVANVLQAVSRIVLAGLILVWNTTVAIVEFVFETMVDIFFIIKKTLIISLSFLSTLAAYVFAGIKMPTFKMPDFSMPEVRIPKIDIQKEDRKEIPHVPVEEILHTAEPKVEKDKKGKTIISKIWSFLNKKYSIPFTPNLSFLNKKNPSISPALTKEYHVLPKGPSYKTAALFLLGIGTGIFGFITTKISNILNTKTGFTSLIKPPKIGKAETQNERIVSEEIVPNTFWTHVMAQAKKYKRTRWGSFMYKMFILGCILTFLALGAFFIWVATLEIPELGNFSERQLRESTKIYDKTGEVLLYDVFEEERRTVVDLSDISRNLQNAILATEDDKFYEHNGVRPLALVRSIVNKIKNPNDRLAGGSTITQQVIKNAILTNERAIERKVKEWFLAIRLEGQLSKEEILEAYFNEIAFGGSVYGVEQAARSFFGKSASEVTIAEAAYIASVPKAPTFYSPYGSNVDRLEGRKDYVIGRMRDLGYISQREYQEAIEEEVTFVVREDRGIKAPHFVFYVIEYLETQYGAEVVERGGLNVITTLDWELQKDLEEATAEYSERLDEFEAENLAAVAIEAKTGKIISLVGSKDYFAEDIDGKFNVATAFRQPGSTFKPFVYAQAFEDGYTPQTVLWDVKTEFSPSCFPDGTPQLPQYEDRCYSPQNYDNSARGPISMQAALAQSLNIPAVKTLYLTGVGNAISMAKKLGITGLNRSASFYGLNLVLGGGEVRLLDMTSAYSVFANDGRKNAPVAIMRVQDKDGNELEAYEKKETQVLSANVARMINEILSDDDLKRPVFGTHSVLYHDNVEVAVKTGTTNSFKDTWTVGYTPDVSVGVWIGNNDNTPLAQRPSSTVAAPYWRLAMDKARERYDQRNFVDPVYADITDKAPVLSGVWQGNERFFVNSETGEPADVTTPEEFREERFLINYHSILHWIQKRNPLAGGSSQSDPLYENWEEPIEQWALAAGLETRENQEILLTGSATSSEDVEDNEDDRDSNDEDDSQRDDSLVGFSITSPESFSVVGADEKQDIEIEVTGPVREIDRIFYYVNNTYLGSGSSRETSTSFVPSSIRTIQNTNVIRVVVQTEDGERIEKEQVFNIK